MGWAEVEGAVLGGSLSFGCLYSWSLGVFLGVLFQSGGGGKEEPTVGDDWTGRILEYFFCLCFAYDTISSSLIFSFN